MLTALARPEVLYKLTYRNFFSDLGPGGGGGQLVIFRAFFLNISRKNSKTSKVNQQPVLNL